MHFLLALGLMVWSCLVGKWRLEQPQCTVHVVKGCRTLGMYRGVLKLPLHHQKITTLIPFLTTTNDSGLNDTYKMLHYFLLPSAYLTYICICKNGKYIKHNINMTGLSAGIGYNKTNKPSERQSSRKTYRRRLRVKQLGTKEGAWDFLNTCFVGILLGELERTHNGRAKNLRRCRTGLNLDDIATGKVFN